MTRLSSRALGLARPVILGLTVANIIYALIITTLLVSSFFAPGWPDSALGAGLLKKYPFAWFGIRSIEVIGLLVAVIVHTILRRLLAIVDTVRVGDPFILENAKRLDTIAWSVLAIELLRLSVLGISYAVWDMHGLSGPTPAPWLAILMLFVLAGVFAHGARIRAELEGTV